MRVFAVQQTDKTGKKHTLSGWLHVQVELVDPTDSIRMIYAQVNDEHFNSIGEFITDNPEEQCKSSNPDLLSPTPYQFIPCNAVGEREIRTGSAIYMVAKQDLAHKTVGSSENPLYMTKKDLTQAKGIHFTWRLHEYWCNRHLRLRPE